LNTSRKQYFSVKFLKHTENCADIFKGPITILGTQVFSKDGFQLEAQFLGVSCNVSCTKMGQ